MAITMIKKRLANGEPCRKCAQAEDLLRRRGLWERIDEIVVADEGNPESPGMRLAAELGVANAPFFVVDGDGGRKVYTSVLALVGEVLAPRTSGAASSASSAPSPAELERLALELEQAEPAEIVGRALERFGRNLVIAWSGAEDVVLLDLAVKSGRPFSVFTLDTGRLHPETYRFIDRVRQHFGIEIEVVFPDPARVEPFVRKKGLFSFYVDGHEECCAIRKVEPLGRTLARYESWMSGQRRDQSPTRHDARVVELDTRHTGPNGPLVKWNPLARATRAEVGKHIRDNELPYNELHDRGFVSIGCEPCTRAVRPGEHERAGRWWWEEATRRECGLHVPKKTS